MAEFSVVMVEPKFDGNVGSVARAMKNFGLRDLTLVNPCALGEDARKRAMHGLDILETATTYATLEDALRDADLVIGTTGIDTENEKKFLRIPMTPREFAEKARDVDGRVALLFGREDFGLLTEELRRCDLLVTIPTDDEYKILNVAQAAVILFYELFQQPAKSKGRKASAMEKERLHEAFSELLAATDYPDHKLERTKVMFRRMVGRAAPSKWEFHAIMGVFSRATNRIMRLEGASRKKPPK